LILTNLQTNKKFQWLSEAAFGRPTRVFPFKYATLITSPNFYSGVGAFCILQDESSLYITSWESLFLPEGEDHSATQGITNKTLQAGVLALRVRDAKRSPKIVRSSRDSTSCAEFTDFVDGRDTVKRPITKRRYVPAHAIRAFSPRNKLVKFVVQVNSNQCQRVIPVGSAKIQQAGF